jgi:predicted GNAT family acetyltransferase
LFPVVKEMRQSDGAMDIRFTGDPGVFADWARDFTQADPFSTNVIGVNTSARTAGTRPMGAEDLWAVVTHGGSVVGAAMHTPPYNLFVSRMTPEAAARLARAIWELGRPLPGVNGEMTAVSAFAGQWAALSGVKAPVDVNMRLYRLDRLRPPPSVTGSARAAAKKDVEMVKKWFAAFQAEALRHQPAAAGRAELRLAANEITLWVDGGEPVSLAACSAAANGVARAGPVYTPRIHRRHGYAAAVTAAATATALERGATDVVLYTDVDNPTSNSVYRSIGYVVDHEATERRFASPGSGSDR